jgi:hypothetical protein
LIHFGFLKVMAFRYFDLVSLAINPALGVGRRGNGYLVIRQAVEVLPVNRSLISRFIYPFPSFVPICSMCVKFEAGSLNELCFSLTAPAIFKARPLGLSGLVITHIFF